MKIAHHYDVVCCMAMADEKTLKLQGKIYKIIFFILFILLASPSLMSPHCTK